MLYPRDAMQGRQGRARSDGRVDDATLPRGAAAVVIGVAVLVIAFFVAVYVVNVVAFARPSLRGDQLHWVQFVLEPYERGDMSLFEAVTFEYANLSHSHIPTLAVFLFSYEFLDLSLDLDRLVGVVALAGALWVVFRQARADEDGRMPEAFVVAALAASMLFRSSSSAVFGWSLLQFQMLYVLVGLLYLRSFVARLDSGTYWHAGLAMPLTLLLGDSVGSAVVVASLVFLVVLRVVRRVSTRIVATYVVLFGVDLVVLGALFRGQREHAGTTWPDFLSDVVTDPLPALEALYYGVSTSFVAMRTGDEAGPLLEWGFAPLWFGLTVGAVAVAVFLIVKNGVARPHYFPILLAMAGGVWILGVVKARLHLAGPEALQTDRYAAYTALVGVALVLLLTSLSRGHRDMRRVLLAGAAIVVVANAAASLALLDHDDAVAAQKQEIADIRAYAADEIQDFDVRGGRCSRISCGSLALFLYDMGVGPFADEIPPPAWESDIRSVVSGRFADFGGDERFAVCATTAGLDDAALVTYAREEAPLRLAEDIDPTDVPADRAADADRVVVRAVRSRCGQSTEPDGGSSSVPMATIERVDVAEGDGGRTEVTLRFVLDTAVAGEATVDWAVLDGTDEGAATLGSDVAPAGGTVTFAAGETVQTVTVAVLGDTDVETDEDVLVLLGNPSPNIGVDLRAYGVTVAATIVDDD